MPAAALHPVAQEAAAAYSDMLVRLENVIDDNQHLRNDIEVERRINDELRKLLDVERREKERHMRYAVTIRTRLAGIVESIVAANELGMDAADTSPVSRVPVDAAEAAVAAALAAGALPKDDGAERLSA